MLKTKFPKVRSFPLIYLCTTNEKQVCPVVVLSTPFLWRLSDRGIQLSISGFYYIPEIRSATSIKVPINTTRNVKWD